jgi:hypothetical protein
MDQRVYSICQTADGLEVTSVLLPLNTTPDSRVDKDFSVVLFNVNAIRHSSATEMISDSINLFDPSPQKISYDAGLEMPHTFKKPFPYIQEPRTVPLHRPLRLVHRENGQVRI